MWPEKKKRTHQLFSWRNGSVGNKDGDTVYKIGGVEDCIKTVAENRMYVLCDDVMHPEQIPFNKELLLDKRTEAYPRENGQIVALKCSYKRNRGFIIPAKTWGSDSAGNELVDQVQELFDIFEMEALSPSSLSEKVLRSTLPEKLFIRRPSHMLRKTFLENGRGPRIDKAEYPMLVGHGYEYDGNKQYLSCSKEVVDPFHSPIYWYGHSNMWKDYPASFMEVEIIAHGKGIPPILVDRNGIMEKPRDGERIVTWLWNEELEACIKAHYTLVDVKQGYSWRYMSTFMQEWVDILWKAWQKYKHPIIKSMMVGVPGRFLRKPVIYKLIPKQQAKDGDRLVIPTWLEDLDQIEWAVTSEPYMQSAQLTPQGDYIRMKARMKLYEAMRKEVERDNRVLRSYVDCYMTTGKTTLNDIGTGLGQWKEKEIRDTIIAENRVIPLKDILQSRIPGVQKESVFFVREVGKYIEEWKRGNLDTAYS